MSSHAFEENRGLDDQRIDSIRSQPMGLSLTPRESLQQLHEGLRMMRLIRSFDERALELRLEKRIEGPVHPYIGQEAIAAGVCAALAPGDRLASHHRGHGHTLAKGAEPWRMF